MISLSLKKDNYKETLFNASLIIAAFCLPFTIKASTYSLILLFLVWLTCVDWQVKEESFKANYKRLIPVTIYILVLLIGLYYTENSEQAFRQVEKNAGFIIIPLILASSRIKNLNAILYAFVLGCFCSLCVGSAMAFLNYSVSKNADDFFYWDLTKPFKLNPIYVSIYLLFAEIIILHSLKTTTHSKRVRTLLIILFAFFFIWILMLASKVAYLCLVVMALLIIFKVINVKGRTVIIILICSFIVAFIFTMNNKFIQTRWKEAFAPQSLSILSEGSMTDFSKVNGLTLRLLFWKYSLGELSKDPVKVIFGQGTGDAQDFLDWVYEQHNLAVRFSEKEVYGYYGYDTHNQFVQILIKNGIFGVASLIILFYALFKAARKEKNDLLLWLATLLLLFFQTESVFETNKGIIFSAFFISLLYINKEIKN